MGRARAGESRLAGQMTSDEIRERFLSFFAERDHKYIIQWTGADHGGRDSAHLASDLLVPDIQVFFRQIQ